MALPVSQISDSEMSSDREISECSDVFLLQQHINKLETDLADTKTLLHSRTIELRALQELWPNVSRCTEQDVLDRIEHLNDSIQQLVLSLVADTDLESVTDETDLDVVDLQGYIGVGLISLLSSPEASQEWTIREILEMSLQACLFGYCIELMESFWVAVSDTGREAEAIHEKILQKRGPEVAGQWRAITLDSMNNKLRPKNTRKDIKWITEYLVLIFRMLSTQAASVCRRSLHKDPRLQEIIQAAFDLNKMMMERLTTTFVEPLSFYGGFRYDSSRMETSSEPRDVEQVLCTTRLGLLSVGWEAGERCLLKAQVVLQ